MIPQVEKNNVMIKGKGTAVLLLHSALSSKIQWFQLMESMRSDYRMIAVDMYGYGSAPFPGNTETFSLSDEVLYVESILKDILPADEPFHLVGHSYGGAVGLRFCFQEQKRIRSLTLFEPVAFHLLPEGEEALARVRQTIAIISAHIKKGDDAAAVEYFVDYWSAPGTFSIYPPIIQRTFFQGIKKLQLDVRALLEDPLSLEDYSKIQCPVCLIGGKDSPIEAHRICELLAENLTDCRVKWVDENHMAPIFQPDKVNPTIESFIRQLHEEGKSTDFSD